MEYKSEEETLFLFRYFKNPFNLCAVRALSTDEYKSWKRDGDTKIKRESERERIAKRIRRSINTKSD